MIIRRAESESIQTINALIRESKSVWDYPREYLEAAFPLLEIDETYLSENLSFEIRSETNELLCFFALSEKDGDRHLDHLWVKPTRIRSGLGRMACDYVFQLAAKKGWKNLFVLPDPPANAFYKKLGFEDTKQILQSRVKAGPEFSLYRKDFKTSQKTSQIYSPSYFRNSLGQEQLRLVDENSFAILMGNSDQSISHLPLMRIQNEAGQIEFVGHMARLNPQWRELLINGSCTAIFRGPHAYVTPSWYGPKASNVPTWNYTVVHARAKFEIVENRTEALDFLKLQVELYESYFENPWQLPSNSSAIDAMLNHIVVFKLTDVSIEAKFKLSQQQNDQDRSNVINELDRQGQSALANYMKRVNKLDNGN